MLDSPNELSVWIKLADDQVGLARQPPHALLVLATGLLSNSEYRQLGIRVLKYAQRLFPNDYWLNRALSEHILWPPQALRFASIAATLRPNDPAPRFRIAQALSALRKPEEAVAEYHDALRLGAEPAVVHRMIGKIHAKQGDSNRAIKAFRTAIAATSIPDRHTIDGTGAYSDLKSALQKERRNEELLFFLEDAVTQFPDFAEFRRWLADFHFERGDWSDAADAWLKVSHTLSGRELSNFADALVRSRRAERAKDIYRRLVADNATYLSNSAHWELESGSTFSKSPVDVLRRAASVLGEDAQLELAIGISLFRGNRQTEAVAAFRRACSLDGSSFKAKYNLASALASVGDHDEALEEYRGAADINAECSSLWVDYGNSLQATGEHDDAIVAFERALTVAEENFQRAKSPGYAGPWVRKALDGLVQSHLALEQNQKAIATRLRRLEMAKASPGLVAGGVVPSGKAGEAVAHLELADLYCRLEQFAAARSAYQEAVRLNPMLIVGHHRLALVGLRLNDTKTYQTCCRTMLDYFSDADSPAAAELTIWTCTLAPDSVRDFHAVRAIAERTFNTATSSDPSRRALLNGAILYREGRYQEAIASLNKLDRERENRTQPNSSSAYARHLLAMAHSRLGNNEQALQYLSNANSETNQKAADTRTTTWIRRMTLGLLRDESEKVLRDVQAD